MDYQQIIEWINLYKIQLLFGLGIVFLFVYKIIKRKKKSVEKPIETKPETEQPPEDIGIEDIDTRFLDVDIIENNNLEFFKELKNRTREEIGTLKEDREKRKGQIYALLKDEKRLRIHIRTLIQQEKMFDEQIQRLEKKDGI